MTRTLLILLFAASQLSLAVWDPPPIIPGPAYFRAPYRELVPPALVVTICRWETRGLPNPTQAVGTSGEIGACQILVGSAREATGYTGTNKDLIAALFERPYWWAQRIADYCFKKGWRTSYKVAYCYNGGPRARKRKGKAHRYARQIASDWAAKQQSKEVWR